MFPVPSNSGAALEPPLFCPREDEPIASRGVLDAMLTQIDLPYRNAVLDKPVLAEDGTELRTLHEAAAFLEAHTSRHRSIPFDAAWLTLEKAAQTGLGADIVDARRMVEIALHDIKLHEPKRIDHSPRLPHPIRLECRELVTVADAMEYLRMLGADIWQHDDYQ